MKLMKFNICIYAHTLTYMFIYIYSNNSKSFDNISSEYIIMETELNKLNNIIR